LNGCRNGAVNEGKKLEVKSKKASDTAIPPASQDVNRWTPKN
jgi:hypothetical protein